MTVLLAAVLLDWIFGEPPNRWHPVAWMGRVIDAGRRRARGRSPAGLVLHGAVLMIAVGAAAAAAPLIADAALARAPAALELFARAFMLKCAFSLRGLFEAVELVRGHLVAGDLDGARRELGRHLVSRRTGELGTGAVASGAIESLGENLTDSWIAPIVFFAIAPVGGIAAAWVYRAVNTADAMIGYREGDLEYLGRVAARADDALNFIPARLAALFLVGGAALAGGSATGAWRAIRRDAATTASPNAGQTMAAMAGALGVTLEKAGHYRLGTGPDPGAASIDRAARVTRWAVALSLGTAVVALAIAGR